MSNLTQLLSDIRKRCELPTTECPTCGNVVSVSYGDEGTNCFIPSEPLLIPKLLAALETCMEQRDGWRNNCEPPIGAYYTADGDDAELAAILEGK